MKVSLNWLKQFTTINLNIDELAAKIGAQLGEIETIEALGKQYQNIVVARVMTCINHPNADQLHVCLLDDGGVVADVPRDANGYVQVVCGADNVHANQTVIWLPPGVIVPESYKTAKPITLAAKTLRGILSNGMIASARELAIGDDHRGIVEILEDIKPGTTMLAACELDDFVIEIENKMFTHRPDLFGCLGVAREIAGIQAIPFHSPKWYRQPLLPTNPAVTRLPLKVDNQLPKLVPRFMAVVMDNITIKPSPIKLQTYLVRLGIRPINNVVDVTNYIMLLTAQPLHAYDYHKVLSQDVAANQATLTVRYPKPGETITLLNSKTITPHQEAILIASARQPIGLAGVMGGTDTEVDEATTSIILECANFNMYSVRKTSMIHGLFTDAVTRFSKGQSVLQNPAVLSQAIDLIQTLSGGQIASRIIDDQPPAPNQTLLVSAQFINAHLGLDLTVDQLSQILQNVEFKVSRHKDSLAIEPPFWRTDISLPEDIVEEVGRMVGYDKLPTVLPQRDLKPVKSNQLLSLKATIRQHLQAAGANELLNYSFVHGKLIDVVNQDRQLAFQLSNALSPDLQYYRLSVLPSLLAKVHPNIKAGFDQFTLFELGKAHLKGWLDQAHLPIEAERLALVFAVDARAADQYAGAAYYQAKQYCQALLSGLSIDVTYTALPDQLATSSLQQLAAPFNRLRSAVITDIKNQQIIGIIGEFKQQVITGLKLPALTAGFELELAPLLDLQHTQSAYRPLSRFPKVQQDISLKLASNLSFSQVFDYLVLALNQQKPAHSYFELQPLDIYQSANNDGYHQLTFRLTIVAYDRTMQAAEINTLLDNVAKLAKQAFNAVRL